MKRKIRQLPGNSTKYDVSNIAERQNSPLKGKQILFLGSSVTYGAASEGTSFVDYLERLDGIQAEKAAVSGTTLADIWSWKSFLHWGSGGSYVSRLKKEDKNKKFDAVVCQLSTNDATTGKELGTISPSGSPVSFHTKTVTGAIEYIIYYVKSTWNCPVIFYTGAYFENESYAQMVDRLKELQNKWEFGILDLYTNKEFNNISDHDYAVYMCDPIHPTKAGYLEWWTPAFEQYLYRYFKQDA